MPTPLDTARQKLADTLPPGIERAEVLAGDLDADLEAHLDGLERAIGRAENEDERSAKVWPLALLHGACVGALVESLAE